MLRIRWHWCVRWNRRGSWLGSIGRHANNNRDREGRSKGSSCLGSHAPIACICTGILWRFKVYRYLSPFARHNGFTQVGWRAAHLIATDENQVVIKNPITCAIIRDLPSFRERFTRSYNRTSRDIYIIDELQVITTGRQESWVCRRCIVCTSSCWQFKYGRQK